MQVRHVDHGSEWADDEEKAAYDGFIQKTPLEDIVKAFPTDRNPKSIRMKLKNHEWERTNGQSGLSGGNKWVKDRWAQNRITIIAYHEKKIADLRARREELYDEMNSIREEIARCERRQSEIVRLP